MGLLGEHDRAPIFPTWCFRQLPLVPLALTIMSGALSGAWRLIAWSSRTLRQLVRVFNKPTSEQDPVKNKNVMILIIINCGACSRHNRSGRA